MLDTFLIILFKSNFCISWWLSNALCAQSLTWAFALLHQQEHMLVLKDKCHETSLKMKNLKLWKDGRLETSSLSFELLALKTPIVIRSWISKTGSSISLLIETTRSHESEAKTTRSTIKMMGSKGIRKETSSIKSKAKSIDAKSTCTTT